VRIDLERVHVPDEDDAEERALRVVALAFDERRPVAPQRRRRPTMVALVTTLVVALVAVAAGVAGPGIVHSVRKAVGLTRAAPALTRLPAAGRLLVISRRGPWIVQPDGSKRLLGAYDDASWSPHGLYVAATRGHELFAVDPHGTVRWSIARHGRLRLARWSPDGYRIAYLADSTLRIVAGDGTGDRLYSTRIARVAPAWRPSSTNEHVLAFVTAQGELELNAVDERRVLARRRLEAEPRALVWSDDGQRLVALLPHAVVVFDKDGRALGSRTLAGAAVGAAFAPGSHELAIALDAGRSRVTTVDLDRPGAPPLELFGGVGRFTGLAWAPDGRWLLVGWSTADQWVFVRAQGTQRIAAVASIGPQFGGGAFPTLEGWCCVEPAG
jgi:WD40 repeat protein